MVEGERHTYVLELILEMRKQGWLWTEEFMWHKKNSYPGKWPRTRLASLSETDKTRDPSKVGSGFGKNISNWVGREKVYPKNVLHLATECANRNHSAVFPIELPTWFIKLFTLPGDVVLDPFVGSGTTAMAAIQLGRAFVGIDVSPEYVEMARQRTQELQRRLPSIGEGRAEYNAVSTEGKDPPE